MTNFRTFSHIRKVVQCICSDKCLIGHSIIKSQRKITLLTFVIEWKTQRRTKFKNLSPPPLPWLLYIKGCCTYISTLMSRSKSEKFTLSSSPSFVDFSLGKTEKNDKKRTQRDCIAEFIFLLSLIEVECCVCH